MALTPTIKNCERQFLSPNFFTGFSAKSIFHGSLQLHHTIPEYMCLHHFYVCSLVNYNEIFSLYFECTLSTKLSHPMDKNKWHQLVSKKLTLHQICQVQCSHLPTNENLFQGRSFRNVDMPPSPRDNFRQQLVYHCSTYQITVRCHAFVTLLIFFVPGQIQKKSCSLPQQLQVLSFLERSPIDCRHFLLSVAVN